MLVLGYRSQGQDRAPIERLEARASRIAANGRTSRAVLTHEFLACVERPCNAAWRLLSGTWKPVLLITGSITVIITHLYGP